MNYTEMSDNLVKVINTLQTLDIKCTYDNMNKLLGCMQVLDEIAQKLSMENSAKKVQQLPVNPVSGNADSTEEPEIKIEEIRVGGSKP